MGGWCLHACHRVHVEASTAWGSWFSPSVLQVLELKLRFSGSVAHTCDLLDPSFPTCPENLVSFRSMLGLLSFVYFCVSFPFWVLWASLLCLGGVFEIGWAIWPGEYNENKEEMPFSNVVMENLKDGKWLGSRPSRHYTCVRWCNLSLVHASKVEHAF